MLNWYKPLYVGDNVKDRKKVIRRTTCRKPQYDVYLVTLAANPENLLEIISANYLLQKTVYRRCPMIVGIASGYGEALALVERIVSDTYEAQQDVDVRTYLRARQKLRRSDRNEQKDINQVVIKKQGQEDGR